MGGLNPDLERTYDAARSGPEDRNKPLHVAEEAALQAAETDSRIADLNFAGKAKIFKLEGVGESSSCAAPEPFESKEQGGDQPGFS